MTDGSNHENNESRQPGEDPSPPSHEPLLTIAEACRIFNQKPHVFRRAIKKGFLPSYRFASRRILLRASDITALINASRLGDAK
jgi:hypothetical protein